MSHIQKGSKSRKIGDRLNVKWSAIPDPWPKPHWGWWLCEAENGRTKVAPTLPRDANKRTEIPLGSKPSLMKDQRISWHRTQTPTDMARVRFNCFWRRALSHRRREESRLKGKMNMIDSFIEFKSLQGYVAQLSLFDLMGRFFGP